MSFDSPLGGNLGAFTCSVFRIEPFTGIPLEPLPDIVPGVTPLRVTLDMVDGETATWEYDVTEHAVQSFLDITTNVHKRLERLTVTGTLAAQPADPPFDILQAPAPGFLVRTDLMRMKNLKRMADQRMPVMVVTPRVRLARGIFTSIGQVWGPDDGESIGCTLVFKEARLVSPLTGDLVSPDFPEQEAGNNVASGGGQSATTTVEGAEMTPSANDGLPPEVGASAGAG